MALEQWRGAVLCSTLVFAAYAPFHGSPSDRRTPTPVATYEVVNVYPHDRAAFTQGLEFVDGLLYEGTGLHGRSGISVRRLQTGEVVRARSLDEQYFGEGITVWHDTIIQLTYRNEIGFVYDRKTLKQRRTFRYSGEGWGLTNDGSALIMSDGSATLRFLDPETFSEMRRLTVLDGDVPVERLNELEFVRGEILANVWPTRRIARISPKTGQVTGWIDLKALLDPRETTATDVLNGIAYDRVGERLFVTGKLWPKLFEIRIVR